MSTDPLDQIEYHLSQAMLLLHQYRGASSPVPKELAGSLARKPSGVNNKSLREWTAWLRLNKPSYRQEIQEATGMNLTAHKSTILDWSSDMAYWPDEQMPADSLCRMRGAATGPGAPPSIYFLWSQRFEVYGLFGVGPAERPEPTESVLGVVQPPTEPIDWNEIPDLPEATPDPEPEVEASEYERFATMDEWYARWVPLFDSLAPYGEPPTAEERSEMIATLPEDTGGEPWSTILARTAHEAKLRSRG